MFTASIITDIQFWSHVSLNVSNKKLFYLWNSVTPFTFGLSIILFSPPEGTNAPDLKHFQLPYPGRVARALCLRWWYTDSWGDYRRKTRVDRRYTPSHHPLFCLWASINFTTICLPIGRKVRAAPTSTKEAFNPSENIVTFHFEEIFKRKENKQTNKKYLDVWNRRSENQ